jgi:hypothetical protein
MKIKIERSGGITGIASCDEFDTDRLPISLKSTVEKLLESRKLPTTIGTARPKGSADFLNYKITIQSRKKNSVVNFNEFDMDKNIKSLIEYVQRNSKKG